MILSNTDLWRERPYKQINPICISPNAFSSIEQLDISQLSGVKHGVTFRKSYFI